MMWTHYLRCDECGVDAGKACREMDQSEALEVCDGRRLRVGDFADRLEHGRREHRPGQHSRRDKPVDTRPQAASRRARGLLDDPLFAPCQHCQTPVRLWGMATVTGRTWCSAVECRRAYDRQRPRGPKKARKCRLCKAAVPGEHPRGPVTCEACRPVAPTLPCHWCGTTVSARGRAKDERACCGAVACVEARRVGYYPKPPPRPPVACAWCDRPIENRGNRVGARFPCCGDRTCKTQVEQIRLRKAVLEKHQHNA